LFPGGFVIFGFNTDVKYADTVYHVQSEAREHELLLQTQVFVKGRCIGKRATSYADRMSEPGFSEEQMHEMLKDQHRQFVAAVREGKIEAELAEPAPAIAAPMAEDTKPAASRETFAATQETAVAAAPAPALAPETKRAAAGKPGPRQFALHPLSGGLGKGLLVDYLPPVYAPAARAVIIGIQVSDDTGIAAGAQVTCRLTSGNSPAGYVYATCNENGEADLHIELEGLDLTATALLIQASFRGKSVSRKYQLQPSS
jgi:hypothetical protein